jgi:hypothetical protein
MFVFRKREVYVCIVVVIEIFLTYGQIANITCIHSSVVTSTYVISGLAISANTVWHG